MQARERSSGGEEAPAAISADASARLAGVALSALLRVAARCGLRALVVHALRALCVIDAQSSLHHPSRLSCSKRVHSWRREHAEMYVGCTKNPSSLFNELLCLQRRNSLFALSPWWAGGASLFASELSKVCSQLDTLGIQGR